MIIVTSKLKLKLFNLTLHCFPNQNNEGNKILCFRVTWIMDGCLSLEEGKNLSIDLSSQSVHRYICL